MGGGGKDDNVENISVYARIRSSSSPAESSDDIDVVPTDPKKVKCRNIEFNLDHAFGAKAEQETLYNVVGAPLVQRVVDGFNACAIAYGQTGSGKTFTMFGPEGSKLDGSGGPDPNLGLVPRACMQLFKMLPKGYTVTTAYMEVYNDGVNDLLVDVYTKSNYLPLRETSPGHIEPDGLTRVRVADTSEVMAAVAKGDSRRVVAAMAMNPRSSRGHGIISIEAFNTEGLPHGRLVLVDLAGMESSKKSGAVDVSGPSALKARQEEAKRINMSLLALSSCVNALSSRGAMRVPFRDSKLTRLLQSSLAGNCKAAFIVTLRGEKKNIEESINTLRFAQRASAVQATVLKVEDARSAKGGGANKKLEEELAAQKGALASYQEKLANAEGVKDQMMAQVQTLLMEMQQLQRDSEEAKRHARQSAYHQVASSNVAALEKRIQTLEGRNRELEAENRMLRQRDIMHRLVELDSNEAGGSVGVDKDSLATFSAPINAGGFAMQVDSGNTLEREKRLPGKEQRVQDGPKGAGTRQGAAKGKAAKAAKGKKGAKPPTSAWAGVRGVFFLSKKSSRVAPTPKVWTKQDLAAIEIQRIWRGKMIRDELAFWDYEYNEYY